MTHAQSVEEKNNSKIGTHTRTHTLAVALLCVFAFNTPCAVAAFQSTCSSVRVYRYVFAMANALCCPCRATHADFSNRIKIVRVRVDRGNGLTADGYF